MQGKRGSALLGAVALTAVSAGVALAASPSFEPHVFYKTGTGPTDVVWADFTGDGQRDLVTANEDGEEVSVLPGKPDGTFDVADRDDYPVGGEARGLLAKDLDGDGRRDLAVTTDDLTIPQDADDGVWVLKGRRNGTLRDPVEYAAGTNPRGIIAADFNRDGRQDLAVANQLSNDVSILEGKRNGTFRNAVDYPVGGNPHGIVATDLDGDGDQDLAVACAGSNGSISILEGKRNGTFKDREDFDGTSNGSAPVSLVAGDFWGNRHKDLAVANRNDDALQILEGRRGANFRDRTILNLVGDAPVDVTKGDFDRDGRTDLAVVNQDSDDISILEGMRIKEFKLAVDHTVGVGAEPVAITKGRFDRGKLQDLAVANHFVSDVSVFINDTSD